MIEIAVAISGRGSNLRALADYAAQTEGCHYRIALVIADTDAALGLDFARTLDAAVVVVPRLHYTGREPFERALHKVCTSYAVRWLCLAGFMRILSGAFIAQFPGGIVNIHPSLLPAYRGLDTHRRVLAAGESTHGCTIHHVTAGLDEGAAIASARTSVRPDDSEETLAMRVLALEHALYPRTLDELCAV